MRTEARRDGQNPPDKAAKALPPHADTILFEKAAERLAATLRNPAVGVLHDFAVLLDDWQVGMILRHAEVEVNTEAVREGVGEYYGRLCSDEEKVNIRLERDKLRSLSQKHASENHFNAVPPISRFVSVLQIRGIPPGVLQGFSDMNGIDQRREQGDEPVQGNPVSLNRLRGVFGLPVLDIRL